jgi:23S rRNA pseudouridine2605 synthase
MRLNRYLAQATGLSRRGADEIIEAGRVRVNDGLSALGQLVTTSDQVWLDGAPLEMPQEHRYVIFHKPVGTITSRRQQGSTPTIYRQLPADFERLRSVGRLDRDSSGLLVLTDDGDYAHRLSHPSFQKNKRYEVELSRPLSQDDANHLRNGVQLEDGLSRLGLEQANDRHVVVTISEGRNRQIRRSFDALGYTVVKLHRTNLGDLALGDLKPGEWRDFRPEASNNDE